MGLLLLLVLLSTGSHAIAETVDSVAVAKQRHSHWRLTGRLHSKGMFMFGGHMGSENPTVDINFTYERKRWGLLFFKGQDLYDHTTFYNFSMLAFFKNIRISDRITLKPYLGTFLSQANSVADQGSDAAGIVILAWKLSPAVSLEGMSMFGNLVVQPSSSDWVNRLKLTYSRKHIEIVPSLWHNNQVLDKSSFWSAAMNIAYSRIAVSEHLLASVGLTGLAVLQSTDETLNPKNNGLMVTLSMQWFR